MIGALILTGVGIFAVSFIVGFVVNVLPVLRRERRLDLAQRQRHDAELVRWAREDGLPDGNVEQLRAYYAAGYPGARRP